MREIDQLAANMPAIMALVTELNTLLLNLPKDMNSDLTVTIGKSTFKLNKKRDEEVYMKFLQTVNEASYERIINLKKKIESLLNGPDGEVAVKSI
jgi:hypothetical protein